MKSEVAKTIEAYFEMVNQSDAEGLGELYSEDSVLFPDRMDGVRGKSKITEFYSYAFSMLKLQLKLNLDQADIHVDGNTAYATTDSTGTRLYKETNETVPEINRELWVLVKQSGDWKIARYCFNKSE